MSIEDKLEQIIESLARVEALLMPINPGDNQRLNHIQGNAIKARKAKKIPLWKDEAVIARMMKQIVTDNNNRLKRLEKNDKL